VLFENNIVQEIKNCYKLFVGIPNVFEPVLYGKDRASFNMAGEAPYDS
jgi:hypothetical protein